LRANLMFALPGLLVLGLCARLGWLLQYAEGSSEAVQRQQRKIVPFPGRPGSIFGRTRGSYVPLAVSRRVPSCYVDPTMMKDEEIPRVSIGLGDVLGLDPVDIQNHIIHRRRARFLWIRRELTMHQAEAVGALKLPGAGLTGEWRREYPSASVAGTVLGFRCDDGRGGIGLELSQDACLAGKDGRRVMLADARRRPICPLTALCRQPKDGCNVFLCLDVVVQELLQNAVAEAVEEFQARWATGVVVDPMTGEVLAMCSVPSFDPSQFRTAAKGHMINRAISMPYEPGSALKPVFAAAAVDAGLVTYQTKINCEGGAYHAPGGGRITDHGSRYGYLTVEDVVVFSSNIGMAKIGEKLGNKALHEVARLFGFGAKASVGLPCESAGIIRPLRRWDGYSTRRVPFGQEISVTALQMAMAFCAIANGGYLMQPRLVDQVRSPDGHVVYQSRPTVVRRVLKPSVAAQSLAVLQQVIERGTGKKCKLPHWTSFGKTGTAQIAQDRHYVSGAFTASFVGGAPVPRPRVVCLISVYWPRAKGHYGAQVAAPYVKKVLEETLTYLDVPADKPGAVWSRPSGYASAGLP
jgi:cell division protein FtsI/penicillin-binding protein 2